MNDWLSIPVKTRIELLREYRKNGMGYSDAKKDFLKTYPTGGTLNKVNIQNTDGSSTEYDINSPEYKKLYESGNLAGYNPKTNIYSAPQIKEIEVVGKRKKNLLQEMGDYQASELKDSSPLGAMLNGTLGAALSIPQLLATKAVTGKVQRPSEAIGIDNQWGALATDVLLDPLNLVGVGILKQDALVKGSKNLRYLPEVSKRTYYTKAPWTWKPNPDNYYRAGSTKEILNDVLDTKTIRAVSKESDKLLSPQGERFSLSKTFPETDTYWAKGSPLDDSRRYYKGKGTTYGDYLIEASNDVPFIKAINQRTKQIGFDRSNLESLSKNYNKTHKLYDYVKPRQSYGVDDAGEIAGGLGTVLDYDPKLFNLLEPDWFFGYKPYKRTKR